MRLRCGNDFNHSEPASNASAISLTLGAGSLADSSESIADVECQATW
jgi:hypothetical protein